MAASGLPGNAVHIHTTYLGGGFGRRGEADFVTDAVETSKAVGKPVKVVWSRDPAAWLLPNFNRLCDRNHFPAPKKPA